MAQLNGLILCLDMGSSRIKGIVYDPKTDRIIERSERSTQSSWVPDLPEGWFEFDPASLANQAFEVTEELRAMPGGQDLDALVVTGAMHSVLFADASAQPLTNLVDWRDKRSLDHLEALGCSISSYLAQNVYPRLSQVATGTAPCAGYGVSTAFWHVLHGTAPKEGYLCTLPDFVTAKFLGGPPITDYSLAASTGLFDLVGQDWCRPLLGEINIENTQLPTVCAAGNEIGEYQGLRVFAPCGDHAAAAFTTIHGSAERAHLNFGTGSQVAARTHKLSFHPDLETRPALDSGYLLVAAGAVGGQTLQQLSLMLNSLKGVPGSCTPESLLKEAETVPSGCQGLTLDPFFSGTREDPSATATLTGLTTGVFSAGHLARACLEGMGREWRRGLDSISVALKRRFSKLTLTGTVFEKSPVFGEIIQEALDTEVAVVADSDISALGVARMLRKEAYCGD